MELQMNSKNKILESGSNKKDEDGKKGKETVVPVELQEQNNGDEGGLTLLGGQAVFGTYDKPLTCFGCGIGWFLFLAGFVFPPLWYYAAILYFGKYYLRDPRERAGLAATAIAALFCTVILLISTLVLVLKHVLEQH